ncbi:MAG: AMP-binding protein [Chloroflexi bacterium]|nr:AMP-binding protein [Chloroflexota bacterium]
MDISEYRTLYSVFAEHAGRQPDREYLIYERNDQQVHRWSFSQFLQSVHQAANLLQSLGICEGDVVNLHLGNHPAYPQLILAASYLGATAMPTNPASTADELSYLVTHSESKIIFTQTDCLEVARDVAEEEPGRQIVLCQTESRPSAGYPVYEAELARQPLEPPPYMGAPEKVVQLLYTSGTTARPKGVMLTNAHLLYGAETFRGATGLRSEDRHLIALPLFHAAAQCHALWPSLVAGCSMAMMSKFSASRFFEQAITYGGTMAALFGAPLRLLLNQPERPADNTHNLRNVTFAQNLTPAQYVRWHQRFRVPLQQLWGMTETGGLPVMSPLTGERNLIAMGRPIVGYEVKVVDEEDREVGPRELGHLLVKGTPGRSIMLGYLKNPGATAKTIRHGADGTWLYSGDTVYYDEKGFVYFVDRGRDLIKRAGENISSTEVEGILMDLPEILDVCVVGMPDALRDEAVVAVVVTKPGSHLTLETIQAHCARHLAAFKVPERVEFVNSLPRTSVGKIQKQIVRDQLNGKIG